MLMQDPWYRTADRVSRRYVEHPELISSLLERLGAQSLHQDQRGFRSTCPIHGGDNKQAFALWFDRGYPLWRCYTRCNERGGLPKLLMRKYEATYQQAVVWLARFAGMDVSGPILRISPQQIQEETLDTMKRRLGIAKSPGPIIFDEAWVQQGLCGMNLPAARLAHQFLFGPVGTTTPSGDPCKGLSADLLRKLQVGFIPASQWTLPDPEHPEKLIGWFQDRLAIPWRTWDGRLIGFAGRRLDGQKYQKFQNFPFTRKAFSLYGIWLPEVREAICTARELVLVEGYADAWRAWQLGIWNVLAVGGIELVPNQIHLLTRFDLQKVTIFLDADDAGVSASRRMADCLRDRFTVRRASPSGKRDPDELVTREEFLAELQKLI